MAGPALCATGRTDRDLVAERTEDTMSQPNREQRAARSDQAAQRRTEQQTEAGVSMRSVRVRAERYLVAPVPRQLAAPTTEPTEAQRAIDALSEDPEIRVMRVIQPAADGAG